MPNSSNSFPSSELNSHELETLSNEKDFPTSTNDQLFILMIGLMLPKNYSILCQKLGREAYCIFW